MDGVDVALLETDGGDLVRPGPTLSVPYCARLRDQLRQAQVDAKGLSDRSARPGCLAEVEANLTDQHTEMVQTFLASNAIGPESIDVIGFHGHTVWHRPPDDKNRFGMTVQLGDGTALAERLGIPVVYDMRAADVAAGGQGAPLVPVYHRALAGQIPQRPLAIVNIGGVANLTWIGSGKNELIAYDTGPGNALIDDFMAAHTNRIYDQGGSYAATGDVDEAALDQLLKNPFFFAIPPKSVDRNAFDVTAILSLSHRDGAATLTAFSAETIARAAQHLPKVPQLWVVSGGGRKNHTLMKMLAERVENAVVPAEAVDWRGDMMEAEAWAFLAVRSLQGAPLTYPGTTGVTHPSTGGKIVGLRPK